MFLVAYGVSERIDIKILNLACLIIFLLVAWDPNFGNMINLLKLGRLVLTIVNIINFLFIGDILCLRADLEGEQGQARCRI